MPRFKTQRNCDISRWDVIFIRALAKISAFEVKKKKKKEYKKLYIRSAYTLIQTYIILFPFTQKWQA